MIEEELKLCYKCRHRLLLGTTNKCLKDLLFLEDKVACIEFEPRNVDL